ncbi:unnamed protein product [Lactuca saligna]|uniref:F-box/LRR-repeat protein 15/At3g58940/PEG3-like LRR domain-containing protein n=1 Tax=Lactuca saligna TaxID=75948 RepID=A0AA35Z3K5_LACSI|nr:unnamed protein product [Lactuca saligna]
MPDAILVLILSRLSSTEEAIRSSILSRRWRFLWTALPSLEINLPCREEFKKNEFKEFVYWVLASKTVDLDSFRLCCENLYSMSTVERWIHMAVTRNVKHLNLTFFPKEKTKAIELPHCLVTCSSLEVLKLEWVSSPGLSLPKFKGFPALRLKRLSINCENRDCCDIKISCPKLVDLNLTGSMACNVFCDRLDSLKKVVNDPVSGRSNIVPVLFHGNSHVKSLRVHLYFLCECFKSACDLALPNLKTLVLTTTMGAFTINELIRILKNCPKLESLNLTIKKVNNDGSEAATNTTGEGMAIVFVGDTEVGAGEGVVIGAMGGGNSERGGGGISCRIDVSGITGSG